MASTSLFPSPPSMVTAVGVPAIGVSAVGVPVVSAASVTHSKTPDGSPEITSARNISSGRAARQLEAQSATDSASFSIPAGLCTKLAHAAESFPLRIMIVDNSGSMQANDGTRLVPHGRASVRKLSASRWEELGDDVLSVANMSASLECRTDFHLLNPRAGFSAMTIGPEWSGVAQLGPTVSIDEIRAAMRTSPCGTTPLTEAVMRVVSMVEPACAALRHRGEQVCVIIATDGLPDNRASFVAAMQQLQRLPVWVVVRLCTDDDAIVDFWNELDRNLEAPLEVLDDVHAEAIEVASCNRWLTYGPPLHSARLFGLPGKLFDDLDEQSLLPSQVKELVQDLLGTSAQLPDPELDLKAFVESVRQELAGAPLVYDPRAQKMKPWIDVRELEWHVKRKGCRPDDMCSLM